MTTLSHRRPAARPERWRMLVDARAREVFGRLPLLLGFSLDSDLGISDVELRTWPGCDWSDQVYGEVGAALARFIAELEDEGADELLSGRTFARALQ